MNLLYNWKHAILSFIRCIVFRRLVGKDIQRPKRAISNEVNHDIWCYFKWM